MSKSVSYDVCVVGGGPAGMVLALLLAHKGVKVLVLEKNRNFDREYRGEVLMPRFTQMLRKLGMESWLETLPQLKLKLGEIFFLHKKVGTLDFSKAAPDVPYALWMPQTVLLNALYEQAKKFPSFEIWFGTHAKHLRKNGDSIEGITVLKDGEEIEVSARVTVGSDGRYSTLLKDGGFEIEYEDYKFDVLWFTIPKPKNYENTFRVLLAPKRSVLLLPKFPDSIQAGILVAPHDLANLKNNGIEPLKAELKEISPLFKEFSDNLHDFTAFHPLQAVLHFVKDWAKPGCVLIGDSAHCCSPAGAIGVSVAVGTAIVAADVIYEGLETTSGILDKKILNQIQERRSEDVRRIHKIQKRVTGGGLGNLLPIRVLLPVIITIIARTPFFRKIQRELMALPEPLPVKSDLGFKKGELV